MAEEKKKINLGKKPNVKVSIYLDISNPESPRVLDISEEEKLNKEALPETIFEVKSEWAKPSWFTSQVIEMNQYIDKLVNGKVQRVFEVSSLVKSRIQVLLKFWNLNELDPTLELRFAPSADNPRIKIINDECMMNLGELDPQIINGLYNKAIEFVYPEEHKLFKDLLEKGKKEDKEKN